MSLLGLDPRRGFHIAKRREEPPAPEPKSPELSDWLTKLAQPGASLGGQTEGDGEAKLRQLASGGHIEAANPYSLSGWVDAASEALDKVGEATKAAVEASNPEIARVGSGFKAWAKQTDETPGIQATAAATIDPETAILGNALSFGTLSKTFPQTYQAVRGKAITGNPIADEAIKAGTEGGAFVAMMLAAPEAEGAEALTFGQKLLHGAKAGAALATPGAVTGLALGNETAPEALEEVGSSGLAGGLLGAVPGGWNPAAKVASMGGTGLGLYAAEQGAHGQPVTVPGAVGAFVGTGLFGMMGGGKVEHSDIQQIVVDAAKRNGVDPATMLGLAESESSFDPSAKSPTGATGLFQFTKKTAEAYGVDRKDPVSSADGAARYMKDLLAKHDGDVEAAIKDYKGFSVGGVNQAGVDRTLGLIDNYRQSAPQATPEVQDVAERTAQSIKADDPGSTAIVPHSEAVANNAEQEILQMSPEPVLSEPETITEPEKPIRTSIHNEVPEDFEHTPAEGGKLFGYEDAPIVDHETDNNIWRGVVVPDEETARQVTGGFPIPHEDGYLVPLDYVNREPIAEGEQHAISERPTGQNEAGILGEREAGSTGGTTNETGGGDRIQPSRREAEENVSQAAPQVTETPSADIRVDESRFQNRTELDREHVEAIKTNWNRNELDPLVVWRDKQGEPFLLAGHHRLQAGIERGEPTLPTREFVGTEAEAIDYAKGKSNANRRMESPLERASIYRTARDNDQPISATERRKTEGKNAELVENLSYLDPQSKPAQDLRLLSRGDSGTDQRRMTDMAEWTGAAVRDNPDLTRSHQNELYTWLRDNYGKAGARNKTEFKERVRAAVDRQSDLEGFHADQPLNIEGARYRSEGEREVERNIKQAQSDWEDARDERRTKKDQFDAAIASAPESEQPVLKERRNAALAKYDEKVKVANDAYIKAKAAKSGNLSEVRKQDQSLFGEHGAEEPKISFGKMFNRPRMLEERAPGEPGFDTIIPTEEHDRLKAAEQEWERQKDKNRAKEPWVAAENRRKPIPRGAQAIIDRLAMERRFKKTGDATTERAVGEFMHAVGEHLFDDVGLSIRRGSDAQGRFDYARNLVTLFQRSARETAMGQMMNYAPGSNLRTMVHELWHSLARYVSPEDAAAMRKQYEWEREGFLAKNEWAYDLLNSGPSMSREKAIEWRKKYPEHAQHVEIDGERGKIVHSSKTYRYTHFDEWWAETMADKTLSETVPPKGTVANIIQHGKDVLRAMGEAVQRAFGYNRASKVFIDFTKGEMEQKFRDTGFGDTKSKQYAGRSNIQLDETKLNEEDEEPQKPEPRSNTLDQVGVAAKTSWDRTIAPIVKGGATGLKDFAKKAINYIDPKFGVSPKAIESYNTYKGDVAYDNYIATEKYLGDITSHLAELSEQERKEFLNLHMQGQSQKNEGLQKMSATIQAIEDEIYKRRKEIDPDLSYTKNHVRLRYEGKGRGNPFSKRPLQGDQGYRLHRTYGSPEEAEAAGLILKEDNAGRLVQMDLADASKDMAAASMWRGAGIEGNRVLVPKGEEPPPGFVPFPDKIRNSKLLNRPEDLAKGEWYGEEGWTRLFSNFMAHDPLRDTDLGRAALNVKAFYTQTELAFGGLHFFTVGTESFTTANAQELNRIATGLTKAISGNIEGGRRTGAQMAMRGLGSLVKNFAETPIGTAAKAYKLGSKSRQIVADENFLDSPANKKYLAAHPELDRVLKNFFLSGGKLSNMDMRNKFGDAVRVAHAAGDPAGELLNFAPSIVEMWNSGLFDHYVANIKIGKWLDEVRQRMEQRQDDLIAGRITEGQIGIEAMRSIENRMGIVNWENLGLPPVFKTAMQIMFRSPMWKGGYYAEAIHAVSGQVRGFGNMWEKGSDGKLHLTGRGPIRDPRLAWLASTALTTMVSSAIVQGLFTGVLPWDDKFESQDWINPAVGFDEDGKKQRVTIPTPLSVFGTMFDALIHHPGDLPGAVIEDFANATAGMTTRLIESVRNEDFRHRQIYDTHNLGAAAMGFVAHLLPTNFLTSNFQEATRQNVESNPGAPKGVLAPIAPALRTVGAIVGVGRPASTSIGLTPDERELNKISGQTHSVGAVDIKTATRQDAQTEIRKAYQEHRDAEAKSLTDAFNATAVARGEQPIGVTDVTRLVHESSVNRDAGRFSRIEKFDDAVHVYRTAREFDRSNHNDARQSLYRGEMAKKFESKIKEYSEVPGYKAQMLSLAKELDVPLNGSDMTLKRVAAGMRRWHEANPRATAAQTKAHEKVLKSSGTAIKTTPPSGMAPSFKRMNSRPTF